MRAAVELHASTGPAATTLSAVAERAGVQRSTLYRHFPDERTLLSACSGLHLEEHPMPDPTTWRSVADPIERATSALGELYAYWDENEQLTANVLRDAEIDTLVRDVSASSFGTPLAAMRDAVLDAWPRRRRTERLAAMVRVALDFHTWQTLARRGGLANADAAALMSAALATAAAQGAVDAAA